MNFLFSIVMTVVIFLGSDAKSVKEQIKEDKSPVEIKAKRLKIENQQRKATFSEDVIAIRGDMKMTCNQLTAYYNEGGSIEKFECLGNVTLTRGEKTATSDRAVYENAKSMVTMTGNPYYTDKENRFWRDIVEYDLDRDEVNVKNIKAVIRVKEEKEKR
ncbi:MAG: hypothetical protein N3B13_00335 [Deltaproteobacteria bacterium]|nr:hypothetical protein [Deltaproteobacteria bacterium]